MNTGDLVLELEAPLVVDVRSARVEEGLSRPFEVTLTGYGRDPDPDFEAVIGAGAAFHIRGSEACGWTGRVRDFALAGMTSDGLARYELTIAPDIWLLSQRRNHRTFQAMSEPAAALSLLAAWKLDFEARLDLGSFPKREMLVQYAESDLSFFSRMLERAGVSYWFELAEGRSKLIVGDEPEAPRPARPVRFADADGGETEPTVYGVRASRELRPGRYTMKDWDLRRAAREQPLASFDAGDAAALEQALEEMQYVPGAFLAEAEGGDAPVGDDRIAVRTRPELLRSRLADRVVAKRGNARVYSFRTNVAGMRPGATFELLSHPSRAFGEGKPYLVVASVLEVTTGERLERACEAVDAAQPYRPRLDTNKPVIAGVQTATVVGPAADEIPTDELSRVRCHFHWDRESTMDEKSSAYMLVASPWAGAGYGATTLPRAGQEVLVGFAGGDPERPIIVGRLYTAQNPVPYKLPENKTQSGWKTNSTGGTGGFNELMFEDKKGDELVRMRAQKNLATKVQNDERRTVDNDRSTTVGRDEQRTVGGNRTRTIDRDGTKSVFGSNDSLVSGDASQTLASSFKSTFNATKNEFTGLDRVTKVAGDDVHIATENEEKAGLWLKLKVGLLPSTRGDVGVFLSNEKIDIYWGRDSYLSLQGPHCTIKSPEVRFSATDCVIVDGEEARITASDIQARAGSEAKIVGAPIELNLDGRRAGHLGHKADAEVEEGAPMVKVGGPSLPANVKSMTDTSITLDNGIIIDGKNLYDGGQNTDDAAKNFIGKTLAQLSQIGDTPSGKKLLDDLKATGKTQTIQQTNEDNSFCRPKDGTKAENGTGSDSVVGWNPNHLNLPPEIDARQTAKMPGTVLFHELAHARHNALGTRNMKPLGNKWDNWEEYNTIWGDSPSEAQYLKDQGINWRRVNHDGSYPEDWTRQ